MDACVACGFVYEELPVSSVPGALRGVAAHYRVRIEGVPDGVLRTRPEPTVWSPLEYVCHVRDLLLVQRERIVLAQFIERPSVVPMARDERVEWCGYDAQGAPVALDQLAMAAELCALVFERVGPSGWRRRLLYNYPEPAERDVGWVGRHSVHEAVHHLSDIERALDRVPPD